MHCNLVNNDYQHDSRVLYSFVPDKSFGRLLSVSPTEFIWLKKFQSEFSYIEVWLTDQNTNPQIKFNNLADIYVKDRDKLDQDLKAYATPATVSKVLNQMSSDSKKCLILGPRCPR